MLWPDLSLRNLEYSYLGRFRLSLIHVAALYWQNAKHVVTPILA
jgi:hypothetical protein